MKLLTQPYLLTLKPSTEMNIVWIQSEPTEAFVEFGSTEAMFNRSEVQCYEISGFRGPLADGTYGEKPQEHPEVSVWQYIAKIENLQPGETVYYRCCCGGEYTKTYFFHTAPREGNGYRFAQISDLQARRSGLYFRRHDENHFERPGDAVKLSANALHSPRVYFQYRLQLRMDAD